MFKTLLATVLASLVSLSAFAAPAACDLNGDGAIDRNDLVLFQPHLNKPAVPGSRLDPNGDGMTNVADVRYCQLRMTPAAPAAPVASASPFGMMCDMNNDGQIDRLDISIISSLRNTPVANNPAADLNGDGLITVNDTRGCVLRCTYKNCSTTPLGGAVAALEDKPAMNLLESWK